MNKRTFEFTVEPWKTTAESLEYTTNIFKVFKREMEIVSENHKAVFSILEAPEWVNVMALTPDKQVVLVEQFRYGTQQATLELAGGVCDPGETPQEAAMRELLEETGFAGDAPIMLGKISSNPAFHTNHTYTVLITNCKKVSRQNLDENERIAVHTVPLEEFLEFVESGIIHHAFVVAAAAHLLLSPYYREQLSGLPADGRNL